jgi:hypothetical protein
MFPVRYELGFDIPKEDIVHSHSRENLKSYNKISVGKQPFQMPGYRKTHNIQIIQTVVLFHDDVVVPIVPLSKKWYLRM